MIEALKSFPFDKVSTGIEEVKKHANSFIDGEVI